LGGNLLLSYKGLLGEFLMTGWRWKGSKKVGPTKGRHPVLSYAENGETKTHEPGLNQGGGLPAKQNFENIGKKLNGNATTRDGGERSIS